MRRVLIILGLFGAMLPAHAARRAPAPRRACSGSSPNLVAATWADVQSCHSAASAGDTITVTSGSYDVDYETSISKYVHIVAGEGGVTLTDNSGSTDDDLILISEATSGSTSLEGFTIVQGTGLHLAPHGVITIDQTTGGKPVIIKQNSYTETGNGNFIYVRSHRGVISENTMTAAPAGTSCLNGASFVRHKPNDGQWMVPIAYGAEDTGGNQMLYVESNTITNVMEAIDVDNDGRANVRYNTFTNSGSGTHGADTSERGGRFIDFNHNTFVRDTSLVPTCEGGTLIANNESVFYMRGGTALIHDNVIPDIADGFWGDKSEVSFIVENIRRNAGPFACWDEGYPNPYQVGWGYIDGVGGTEAGSTGLEFEIEPVYIWSNSGAGNYDEPSVLNYGDNECMSMENSSDYIQEDREYFVDTAKPSYVEFEYPHPLLSAESEPPVAEYAFTHYKKVTVATGQMPSSQVGFVALLPFLDGDDDLRTVGNGGYVQDDEGDDIRPYSDACFTPLPYEKVWYDGTLGKAEIWIKATLDVGTDVYVCFGTSEITMDGSSRSSVWSGYLSVLHMGDGVSLSMDDSSPEDNDATNGGTVAGTGVVDGGLTFTSDYVDLGTFTVSGSLSVSCWVKHSSVGSSGSEQQYVIRDDAGDNRDFILYMYNDGGTPGIYFFVDPTLGGNDGQQTSAVTAISADTWYLLSGVFEPSSILQAWVNGIAQTAGTAPGNVHNSGLSAYLGSREDGGSHGYFAGEMDECRIGTDVRSTDWWEAEYNNGIAPDDFWDTGMLVPIEMSSPAPRFRRTISGGRTGARQPGGDE